jgi:NTE family protein
VAEVRELCHPDVVIAVNVASPLLKPDEVKGIGTVLGQVVNLLTEQNVAASLALLKADDIYIKPELEDVRATDFTRQLDAAEGGRKATRAMAARLGALALPPAEYEQWQRHVRLTPPRQAPIVDRIEIAGTRFVNPETIRTAIAQKEGQPLDPDRLAADLVREYSQGDLHSLDYSVVHERDRTILRITPVEKSWGPDYLRFGLNLASDFRSESSYNLRALYRRTWLNPLGGEWVLGGQIGSLQSLATEFYQPLDLRHRFFVRPYAVTSLRKEPVYSGGDRLAIYRVQDNRAGIDLGMNLGVHGQAAVGWLERHIGAVLDTGPNSFLNATDQLGGPTATIALDSYDQPFFPTRGMRLDGTYFDATHVGLGLTKYGRAEARFGAAWSHGRWTWLGGLEGGTTSKGTLPVGDAFTLGGPRRLSGFAQDQLLGQQYAFGRFETQYRLHYASPLWGLTLIAGVMAEAGRMNKPFVEGAFTGTQRSVGAYLAANTLIGPVYLGVAEARNGKGRFYLFIGTP